MVITMLSTKAKIGLYTGAEQNITQSGDSSVSVVGLCDQLAGSKKDILGSVLLGRHTRVIRISFSYFMGSQKILSVALTIPAFSEPWQWKSWETPPLSRALAQKSPHHFQSQSVGGKQACCSTSCACSSTCRQRGGGSDSSRCQKCRSPVGS